nr:Chain A, Amyloid-forming peptide TAVVTN [synthetic construct]
TAVVTN